jgi:hypothetical protein
LKIYSYDFGWAPYITISVGSQVSYHFGVSFDGISGVAQGANITSARLKMKLDSHGETPTLRIYGHDADTSWRDTGTHDGGTHATILTDSTASWTVDALIGRTVDNVTDGSTGTVTDNDATTVTLDDLTGGTDDQWEASDKYEIYEPTVRTIWDGMQSNLTTAYVDWSPDTQALGTGEWFYSPDIKNVIQEITDRAGFGADSIAVFVKDNSSGTNTSLNVRSYDYSGNADGPYLEVDVSVAHATSPTYFMYVSGATEGEIWKLDENRTPADVTQVAEAHANAYQNQIAKFMQFGDDLLFTDDAKSDPQIWDVSAAPSLFVDLIATIKGRYWNEFKSRAWLWYVVYGGVIYQSQGVYSAVNDATSFDTTNDTISLPGFDSVTYAINLSQDEQIVFKEGATYRIIDRQTPASDFQPFLVSPGDGSLGANVISDGARLYGINDKGIWQWPVQGYPGGFRYIHQPIQDEFDKLTLPLMRLVWFAHWPGRQAILMNYADSASYNNLCAVYNYQLDRWENISNIFGSNVMDYAFDQSGNPIVLLGKEDGHLKYITGDDNGGNSFSGILDTGAVYKLDQQNSLVSRRLTSIEPSSNYDGSMTIQFFVKAYDRVDEESSAAWQGPYTHDSTVPGNKEMVPIAYGIEGNYHIIRVEGALADEAFEIYALGLNFDSGSR